MEVHYRESQKKGNSWHDHSSNHVAATVLSLQADIGKYKRIAC